MGYYYEYDYGFHPGVAEFADGVAAALLGFFLVFYLLIAAFGVVSYVLQSLGVYTIAKRRGIRNPWLAWLPVGDMWILGSISDQYQYVVKGRIRNRRKVLLWLTIAMWILGTVISVCSFVSVFHEVVGPTADEVLFGAAAGVTLLAQLVFAAISVVAAVFCYMALYDLYVSCEPSKSILHLLLSIFVSVTLPFFVFASRNKDLGMPPRRETPQEIPLVEAVVEEPADTTEE